MSRRLVLATRNEHKVHELRQILAGLVDELDLEVVGAADVDGAPDVAFQGHEFFLFATDHQEFTPSGVIGNPLRSSAEKGNRTYERYAEHLAAALAEFEKLEVEVHTREWRQIV